MHTKDKINTYEIDKVAQGFNLNVKEYIKLDRGLVNETYIVTDFENGKYVFQKVSNEEGYLNFFEVANSRTKNYEILSNRLMKYGKTAGWPLKTAEKKYIYRTDSDAIWRAFEYIENDDVLKSVDSGCEAGRMLGLFHEEINKEKLPAIYPMKDFHNTKKILNKLIFLAKSEREKSTLAESEIIFVIKELPHHFLNENLPSKVIHGDPKIDNFLFKESKAIGIIDLDTIMRGSVYIDLGDSLRSWCNDKGIFNKNIFKSFLSGYSETTSEEIDTSLALQATKMITLELTVRVLIDYFEEEYFDWDNNKYKTAAENNLYKAKNLLKYFKTIN